MAIKDNTNWNDLGKMLNNRRSNAYKAKAIQYLMVLGERAVKYARDDMSSGKHYSDQTGNLRNSIGYIVVQDGRVVVQAFEGQTTAREGNVGDPNMAHQKGLSYATDVSRTFDAGKTYLIVVAGMEYAAAVEAKHYDVIIGTHDWLEASLVSLREEFRRFLKAKM